MCSSTEQKSSSLPNVTEFIYHTSNNNKPVLYVACYMLCFSGNIGHTDTCYQRCATALNKNRYQRFAAALNKNSYQRCAAALRRNCYQRCAAALNKNCYQKCAAALNKNRAVCQMWRNLYIIPRIITNLSYMLHVICYVSVVTLDTQTHRMNLEPLVLNVKSAPIISVVGITQSFMIRLI